MAKRRKGRAINGVLLLDKPYEMSSNHALQAVKRIYFAQKAGHTGALDPLATGMLPVCLGEGTKFSQFLLDTDKTYQVTAKLGIRTTTSDADGEVVSEKPVNISDEQLARTLDAFRGTTQQVPSMYSALMTPNQLNETETGFQGVYKEKLKYLKYVGFSSVKVVQIFGVSLSAIRTSKYPAAGP